jgi:hypothetical protein
LDTSEVGAQVHRQRLDVDLNSMRRISLLLKGMDQFSAFIVLSQVTAQQYLDMTPQDRIESFALVWKPCHYLSGFPPYSILALIRSEFL